MGELTEIAHRWEWVGNMCVWLIFTLWSLVSTYQELQVVLGRLFPTKGVLGRAGEALECQKLQGPLPRMVFAVKRWVQGFQCRPLSHVLPLSYFLLSSDILRLPSRDVASSSSWKSWQHSVVLCLSSWQMYLYPSQAEWDWAMLNLHKTSKKWYWFFLDFLLFIFFWGRSLIRSFKARQVTLSVSFAVVSGMFIVMDFIDGELFSLIALHYLRISYTGGSTTRSCV